MRHCRATTAWCWLRSPVESRQVLRLSFLLTFTIQASSCARHGAAAGVILFFTCVSAVAAPLAMGAIGDAMGHIRYAFWLAAAFSALLFVGLLLNWIFDPTRDVLERLNRSEYEQQPASV